jgi:8-oxo-dGTP pyrophosphatase MutT (NUDIX family)
MNKTKFGLGVFVCIFNTDFSKIMLLKRNKEKIIEYGCDWGNVGGKIELGETSAEACLREAKEECGLNLNKKDTVLISVLEFPDNPYYKEYHVIQFVYSLTISEKTKITINSESDSFQWFDINSLPDKMLDTKEDILKYRKSAIALMTNR